MIYKTESLNLDFENICSITGDALCIADKDLNVQAFNKHYADLVKLKPDQLLGINALVYYPEFEKSVFFECLSHTVKTGQPNIAVGYSNNSEKHLISRTFMHEDYLVLVIQEFKAVLQKSSFTNIKDSLTSLYNKECFEEDITQLLKSHIPFSLVLLDINNFKAINNEFGMEGGDLVLMETAARLKKSVQEKIYRLHSNLFAVTMLGNKDKALSQITSLLKTINAPLNINGKDYMITASAGVNHVKTFEDDLAIVISNTETALKKAKTVKNAFFEHSHTYTNAKKNEMSLIKEIDIALKTQQLRPYYQGQIDVLSKKIMGAEALVRWEHPTKGVVLPGVFLNTIKEHGRDLQLDQYMLEQAFKDAAAWQSKWPLKISVNLSSASICSMNTLNIIEDLKRKYRVNPEYIAIEITEDALMTNLEVSKKVVQELKGMGFQIALDDFGTGYSSLGYLLKYPTDYLKIDKEFITGIDTSRTLQSVTSNIIKMGTSLGMLVIAEGIETKEEALVLKTLGCTIAQGFFFTKPVNKEQFEGFVERVGTSDLRSSLR